jgi:hypothetical protein
LVGIAQERLINAVVRPLGFRVVHLGMEGHAAQRNQMAMEGLGTLISDVFSAIIKAIKRFCGFIMGFFGWSDAKSESQGASCKRLEDRLYKVNEGIKGANLSMDDKKLMDEIIASVYAYYDAYDSTSPDKWDVVHPKLVEKKDEYLAKMKALAPKDSKDLKNLRCAGLYLTKDQLANNGTLKYAIDGSIALKKQMEHSAQLSASIRALVADASDAGKDQVYLENRVIELIKMTQHTCYHEGLSKKGSDKGLDKYEGTPPVGNYDLYLSVAKDHGNSLEEGLELLFGFHYECQENWGRAGTQPTVFKPTLPTDSIFHEFTEKRAEISKLARDNNSNLIKKNMDELEKLMEKLKKDEAAGVVLDSFRSRIIQKAAHWNTSKLYKGLIDAHLPYSKFTDDFIAYRKYCQDVYEMALVIVRQHVKGF